MKPFTLIVALALVALPLAGCVGEEESSEERTRGMVVSIPEDVDRLEVEVTASAEETARIQVEIEEENGTDIQEDNFEVSGGNLTRIIEVDVGDRSTVAILVTVASGDAFVSVAVRGLRDAQEPVLIRHETFYITMEAPTPTPAGGEQTPTPTPTADDGATPTPAPTPTQGAGPSPTPQTNTTEGDNETNATNETNSTP